MTIIPRIFESSIARVDPPPDAAPTCHECGLCTFCDTSRAQLRGYLYYPRGLNDVYLGLITTQTGDFDSANGEVVWIGPNGMSVTYNCVTNEWSHVVGDSGPPFSDSIFTWGLDADGPSGPGPKFGFVDDIEPDPEEFELQIHTCEGYQFWTDFNGQIDEPVLVLEIVILDNAAAP